MGHSDIGVTMNTYTHLGLDAARDEMVRMEELEQARKEVQNGDMDRPAKRIGLQSDLKIAYRAPVKSQEVSYISYLTGRPDEQEK